VSEKMSNKRIERRKFLGAVAAVGATAAVGTASAATLDEEVTQAVEPEGLQEGYRETAHIRRYYETARF